MSETKTLTLSVKLDPAGSRALMAAVERRRRARGWSRKRLASVARHGVTVDALNTWAYKIHRGVPTRIDLDKALALLAAVGIASNDIDDLIANLTSDVASLIAEAADLPEPPL